LKRREQFSHVHNEGASQPPWQYVIILLFGKLSKFWFLASKCEDFFWQFIRHNCWQSGYW